MIFKGVIKMLDEIDRRDFTAEEFVRDYIIPSRPLLFRNFFSTETVSASQLIPTDGSKNYDTFETGDECATNSFLELVQNTKLNCEVYGCFKTREEENKMVRCSNMFLSQLIRHPDLVVQEHMRMWKHDAGKYTRVHYDANNINVFNFSLKGSKTFFLAPPGSRTVFPMTNIGVLPHMSSKEVTSVTLNPGELLYIPSCWFHSVLTNEPSININMGFFHRSAPSIINRRDNDVIYVNKMLKSYFYQMDCIQMHPKDRYFAQIYTQCPRSCLRTLLKELGVIMLAVSAYSFHTPSNKVHGSMRIVVGAFVVWYILSRRESHGGLLDVYAYTLIASVLVGVGARHLIVR